MRKSRGYLAAPAQVARGRPEFLPGDGSHLQRPLHEPDFQPANAESLGIGNRDATEARRWTQSTASPLRS